MADAEWDTEDFEPTVFKKPDLDDRWEGEDEEENVKDNWDDEEEEAKEAENAESNVVVQTKKKRPLAAVIAEKEERKRKELEEKKKMAEVNQELSPQDLLAEKLRQQKLQEESDLELAKETFGVTDTHSIDHINPSTKEDFDNFGKALLEKISKYETSVHYFSFLEDLFRDLCLNMQPDDLKKITSSLNALVNEKVKAQKIAKAKKKSKKATLNLGKDDLAIIDYGNEYEDCI